MSSELEILKQRIIELEAENAEIPYLRNKLSVSDAEIAELKRRNAEFLRANITRGVMLRLLNSGLRMLSLEIDSRKCNRISYKMSREALRIILLTTIHLASIWLQ